MFKSLSKINLILENQNYINYLHVSSGSPLALERTYLNISNLGNFWPHATTL